MKETITSCSNFSNRLLFHIFFILTASSRERKYTRGCGWRRKETPAEGAQTTGLLISSWDTSD